MNKEKLITIIFPSRERYDLVEKLLLSIEKKTHNKDWIEVISICDHDDKKTLDLFYKISSQITYDFKFISRKQNSILNLPNDYYNLGLKLASDSYFTWILGNDCELKTDNWDQNLFLYLNQLYPEWESYIEENQKFFYVKINDDTHWDENENSLNFYDQSCCFPLLSSNYCNTLNEFYPIEVPTWGGDGCLYNLIQRSNISLILNCINIIGINHYSIHNQKTLSDNIHKRVEESHLKNKIQNSLGELHDPWAYHNKREEMFEIRKSFLYK
jgi:hypothetical protein